ncbi:hypothetical protein A8C32_18145 [Flavivirga aquatica]|uniref:Uncharacterized protein n=1 Tax=Flavivirga aquatica TaxID=1849968 RepID=A0A1E5T7P3_9FLAO|nr:hypothetical protein [Flavivirga aquatica]OEK07358.1 hypothetical protein A8C32_18145 [Flavivirga aquatica]
MKHIYIIIFLSVFGVQLGFSQFFHVHIHINNTDTETRSKLAALTGILALRNGTLIDLNKELSGAVKSHNKQRLLQYTKNKYDKGNGFITSAATSSVLSLGASTLASRSWLPYMTKDKRDYLNAITMEKGLLLALQNVSKTKIKSSKRQEVYRLRDKLLREFSKNDRDARKTLFLPLAGLTVINYKDFLKLYRKLKKVDIAL